ncbi:MAG: ABC transporter permease [Kofleriaceae bacterium]|nr:ABC transporter permease [Kofleriaceae bacterium]
MARRFRMVVSPLQQKLLRDIWTMRGQVITIALVLASAIAALTSMVGTYRGLRQAQINYYERTEFPDIFAHASKMPRSLLPRIAALPGVARVHARTTEPALLRLDGQPGSMTAQLIELDGGQAPSLRGLLLHSGRLPVQGRTDEALVLAAFADAHQLPAGTMLHINVGGTQHKLRMVGSVQSPEYIFSMGTGGMMPDDRRFTAIYVPQATMVAMLGSRGTFNDLRLELQPASAAQLGAVHLSPETLRAEVVAQLDLLLTPYGNRGAYQRAKHPSHMFVSQEIDQLKATAVQVPIVFLFVAVFLLNVTLSRVIATQREQIAALRALGYTRGEVGRHYLSFVLLIAVIGGGLGIVLGFALGQMFCDGYASIIRLPGIRWEIEFDLVALGMGTAVGAASLGAWRAVASVMRLAPAEAMRPPSPASYQRRILSRLGVVALLSATGRMAARELERRPLRAAFSVLGLALAMSLIVLGHFSRDTIENLAEVQFRRAMPADVTFSLSRAQPLSALASFRSLPGVVHVEGVLNVPVRVTVGTKQRDLLVQALPATRRLTRVLDRNANDVTVPPTGLLLSKITAARLGLRVGDTLALERRDGIEGTRAVVITALSDQMVGRLAYMDLAAFAETFVQEPRINTVTASVRPDMIRELQQRVATMPGILAATESQVNFDNFEATTGSFTTVMTTVVLMFGIVIAVGVVYNNGRVTLSERSRELATLRVLGFTSDEVAGSLISEMVMHLVLAMPLAYPIGTALANGIMSSVDAEQYQLNAVIDWRTWAMAYLVVAAASAATALGLARRVKKIDPVIALKARD